MREPKGLNGNCGGGVGIIIKECFEYEILSNISISKAHTFECVFVKVYLTPKKYIIIGSIYRPNTGNLASISEASSCLSSILGKIKMNKDLNKANNIFLTGDFNVNLLNYQCDNEVAKFLDNLINYNTNF